jgi:hypothetical protein
LRWQARRRSPNRLGNRYSAGERPRPHAAGRPAAPDRRLATGSVRVRPTRDMDAPRRSLAIVRPPAGSRSPAGAHSPADTRSLADTRSPATAPPTVDGHSQDFRCQGFRCQGFRCRGFRCRGFHCPGFGRPGFRFPATVPWPATAQSPAAACPAAGLAPEAAACQATTPRPSMAPAPRLRATARTRSVRTLAARCPGPPQAAPGGHAQGSPARPRPRTRPGGLGLSSRAWFASCFRGSYDGSIRQALV